jgi:hypothetical protein
MAHPLPLPPGRWLRTRPKSAGVYLRRYSRTERPIVSFFDPREDYEPSSYDFTHPAAVPWSIADPEWYYCDGDQPGFPRRADAP